MFRGNELNPYLTLPAVVSGVNVKFS